MLTEPDSLKETLLPRFSDPRDIDEFVAKLEAFERNEISSEEFRAFRLLRGVYGQRQEGVQMLRVKIPFGRLDGHGLCALADVADAWAHGKAHVTTRQNVQFHFVKMTDVEAAMRTLDGAGLTTREACGNSVRAITACERAEVCTGAPFDVTPYAEALTRLFLRHPLSSSLPRKFKIAFSGCDDDCAKAQIHDLGFIAKVSGGERGFTVVCAGGLSSSPQAAITLHEFLRAEEIGRVGEAIVRLFHRLGNRENRHRARLKYVLRKLGEEGFRAKYAEARREVDEEATRELEIPGAAARTPASPVPRKIAPLPEFLAWRGSSVVDQKSVGHVGVYVRLDLGNASSDDLRALGRIAERFGDGTVRLTIDQNVLIPWVDRRSLAEIHSELSARGLARLHFRTARDVTSCPGASSCNLAVTKAPSLARAIETRLASESDARLSAIATTSIKVSGCPHGCGQHHVADIGWHGAAKNISGTTVPVYQLHLGGGVNRAGARFGRQIVKVIARRVPDAVALLLELYESDKTDGETPSTFFARVDSKRVLAALGDTVLPQPSKDESTDIGETSGFLVETRDGECAA